MRSFSFLLTFLLPSVLFATPITSSTADELPGSASLTVDSTLLWNPLKSMKYKAGTKLNFQSDPTSVWYDVNKKIETTADGYPNAPGVTMRYNVSNDNIMAMICCMNNVLKNCANVGSKGNLLLQEDGFVSCFANDNANTYGNNYGSIVTTITPV